MRAILLGSVLDRGGMASEHSKYFWVAVGAECVAGPLGRAVWTRRAAAAGRSLSRGSAELEFAHFM